MGLKRVNMELMRREKSRLVTFRKRKESLMKKASEFSILCGVDACVIVFGPRDGHGTRPVKVETWPSNPDEVRTVIRKFKQSDRPKKPYALSDYFADKKKNANVEAAKLREKYLKTKYPAPAWDDRLINTCSPDQLSELLGSLNSRIVLVQRLRMVKSSAIQANQFRAQNGQPVSLQHGQMIRHNPILTDQESWNSFGNGYSFQPRVDYQQNLMNNLDAVMTMQRAHQNNTNQYGMHYYYPNNYAESSSMNYLNSLMTMPTYTHLPVPSFRHQDEGSVWRSGSGPKSAVGKSAVGKSLLRKAVCCLVNIS